MSAKICLGLKQVIKRFLKRATGLEMSIYNYVFEM